LAEKLARAAIKGALEASGAEQSGPSELVLVLSNDENQQALNKKWRRQDRPTNVLSFPQITPFSSLSGILGDIVLARETLVREAIELEIVFEHHYVHLVVHGFLHILGYDHQTDTEAFQMESLETQILAHLGIADPYGQDAGPKIAAHGASASIGE
jgi:probable rRNA maturation factor